MNIELKGTYTIQNKEVLLFSDVYEDEDSQNYAEVWEEDEQILSIPSHDENVIKFSIIAYDKGFDLGQEYGEFKAQARIQNALGL